LSSFLRISAKKASAESLTRQLAGHAQNIILKFSLF
jgi:hypothetical protein